MPHIESKKYLNKGQYHGNGEFEGDGQPYCPECKSLNVLEQGFDHNHRHHCRVCNVTYWITRS